MISKKITNAAFVFIIFIGVPCSFIFSGERYQTIANMDNAGTVTSNLAVEVGEESVVSYRWDFIKNPQNGKKHLWLQLKSGKKGYFGDFFNSIYNGSELNIGLTTAGFEFTIPDNKISALFMKSDLRFTAEGNKEIADFVAQNLKSFKNEEDLKKLALKLFLLRNFKKYFLNEESKKKEFAKFINDKNRKDQTSRAEFKIEDIESRPISPKDIVPFIEVTKPLSAEMKLIIEKENEIELYKLEREIKDNVRAYVNTPNLVSGCISFNYSELGYINIAGPDQIADKKDRHIGFGLAFTYARYLGKNALFSIALNVKRAYENPESKFMLPDDISIPLVWFSQPTYFEPLVKKEKLDIILRLTKKEGEHLAFNPGIKFVGDIEDMQKKYSLSGFISVYIRMIEKKEKEEIPWSICLKPMVTYDRSKKSTSFSVGIIFLGDFSPKIF